MGSVDCKDFLRVPQGLEFKADGEEEKGQVKLTHVEK